MALNTYCILMYIHNMHNWFWSNTFNRGGLFCTFRINLEILKMRFMSFFLNYALIEPKIKIAFISFSEICNQWIHGYIPQLRRDWLAIEFNKALDKTKALFQVLLGTNELRAFLNEENFWCTFFFKTLHGISSRGSI